MVQEREMSMNKPHDVLSGTIVWVAPFYNRSGYGVGARATVSALHRAGARIRIISVNEVEAGIDDCDLNLIKSLETTPVIPPITAIVTHVPSKAWLNIKLPEPNLRIMATTFDSSAQGNQPPAEWMAVFEEMDQVWLMSEKERKPFLSAGLPSGKVQVVHWPHPWLENPLLPLPAPKTSDQNKPFRLLSIAMFQPRRRWDTLIEAYLEEFNENENVELYLKVNYPSWHPVPGKPRHDLQELIRSLRQKTGSQATIIIDEELGTRTGIVHLIDSCNVYVSTDTTPTAPVSEALVRQRLTIMPDGLLGISAEHYISITVDPNAKLPVTQDMLLYQPHHKGTFMPQLHVGDVRNAMRHAYNMPLNERQAKVISASLCVPGPADVVPKVIKTINDGWKYKALSESNKHTEKTIKRIAWEGSQFVYHSLALINRELCLQLLDSGHEISIIPYERDQFGADADPRFTEISSRTNKPLTGKADVHVRHQWPPNLTPPPEGRWVIIQPWEFGSLPEEWVRVFSTQVDEMWVPSNYVRQVYIESGVPAERVVVIPNGVNPEKFHPGVKPYSLKTQKKFKFLFVGGTIHRKGIDLLLQAYLDAFKGSDDVCLVIKDMGGNSFYSGQTLKTEIQRIQNSQESPEIEYIDTMLSEDELVGLYTACNILVHPYRGEGFGLPILEAMACGVPAIVTNGGACLDFCNSSNSLLVKAVRKQFKEKCIGDRKTVGYPWMFEVELDDLKDKMRYACNHPEEIRALGKEISQDVRDNWTWAEAAGKITERIEYLKNTPIRRYAGETGDSTSEGLFHVAEELFQKGAYPEAIVAYKKVIAGSRHQQPLSDDNAYLLDAYHNLAMAYASINQTEAAISTLKRAIEWNDSDPALHNNLGVMCFKSNMHNDARACFEKALSIDTGYKEAQKNLKKVAKALA